MAVSKTSVVEVSSKARLSYSDGNGDPAALAKFELGKVLESKSRPRQEAMLGSGDGEGNSRREGKGESRGDDNGTWNLELGTWNLELGTWDLKLRFRWWNLAPSSIPSSSIGFKETSQWVSFNGSMT